MWQYICESHCGHTLELERTLDQYSYPPGSSEAAQTGDNKAEGVLLVLLSTDLIPCAMEDVRKTGDVLQRSEFTVRALLESAAQAILAVNVEGRLVLANPMVEKMFGYSQIELIGQPLELLLPKDSQRRDQDHQTAFFANLQKRPMGLGLDLQGQRKDGSQFPIEVSLNHIDTSEGRLGVDFISYITERKRADQA